MRALESPITLINNNNNNSDREESERLQRERLLVYAFLKFFSQFYEVVVCFLDVHSSARFSLAVFLQCGTAFSKLRLDQQSRGKKNIHPLFKFRKRRIDNLLLRIHAYNGTTTKRCNAQIQMIVQCIDINDRGKIQ
eukprot:TRINITY_DN4344_c0_g1_i1.p5 TRINITY_DN4344_c0_g1~~TRINITY_DN4344_c0_g1_i1.p5  ORF type:complete len:136 (-),score=3.09 TRINITY_DN4344_c0_g1_i1:1842-2249(-)